MSGKRRGIDPFNGMGTPTSSVEEMVVGSFIVSMMTSLLTFQCLLLSETFVNFSLFSLHFPFFNSVFCCKAGQQLGDREGGVGGIFNAKLPPNRKSPAAMMIITIVRKRRSRKKTD